MFTNAFLNRVLEKVQDQTSVTPHFSRYEQDKYTARTNDSLTRTLQFNSTNPDLSFALEVNQFPSKNQQAVNQSTYQKESGKQSKQMIQVCTGGQVSILQKKDKVTENQDESNEFLLLKNQMIKIQSLALQQMSKLKTELVEKEEQIGKLLNVIKILREKQTEEKMIFKQQQKFENKKLATKDQQTQTESDYKNEQIKSLKEALVRHIRINKDLTKRLVVQKMHNQNDSKSSNMINSIDKLVSKIQM